MNVLNELVKTQKNKLFYYCKRIVKRKIEIRHKRIFFDMNQLDCGLPNIHLIIRITKYSTAICYLAHVFIDFKFICSMQFYLNTFIKNATSF